MIKTVLVTGGSGFIGSHILRKLAERGDRVINYSIREPAAEATWWLSPVAERIRYESGSVEHLSGLIDAVKKYQPALLSTC